MIKSYSGFALPDGGYVAFRVEYRCPNCACTDVDIDPDSPEPDFCDGGPETSDKFARWLCPKCGHSAEGETFFIRRYDERSGPAAENPAGWDHLKEKLATFDDAAFPGRFTCWIDWGGSAWIAIIQAENAEGLHHLITSELNPAVWLKVEIREGAHSSPIPHLLKFSFPAGDCSSGDTIALRFHYNFEWLADCCETLSR